MVLKIGEGVYVLGGILSEIKKMFWKDEINVFDNEFKLIYCYI